jgi:hypothetical protein
MTGYRLRPFSQSALDHLAEARLGFLNLPFHIISLVRLV